MDIITIFVTSDLGESLDDFAHGTHLFTFDILGEEGPQRLIEGPVWVFVDWVMDDLAGLAMCRRLRADPRMVDAYITMVLDADNADDRRRALKVGADDYVVGPLTKREILDRVMAVQANGMAPYAGRTVELGDLVIDIAAMQARWIRKPIDLRPNEFRLLRYFAQNPNRVLSRDDLITALGKREPPIDERTVDVWIGRLRRAIKAAGGGNPLRTVRSKGYVLDLR